MNNDIKSHDPVQASSMSIDNRGGASTKASAPRRARQPVNRFFDMHNLSDYTVIQKLGQGTFGVVQKAKRIKTNELVALKQLINHSAKEGFPITAMREITILKSLHHRNILRIIDMVYEPPKVANPQDLIHSRGCFYTVSPYMSSDLVGLLENPKVRLSVPQIKCLMLQLLRGVNYIHEQRYLHRDIKAANILIDFNGVLKIADFGLARQYHGKTPKPRQGPGGGERNYTALVVTRWYRPPELLLGERKYTTSVDMWGVGCVFGELFVHKPILAGQSDAQQAQIIFDLVGPPTPGSWAQAAQLPNKTDFTIGLKSKRSLESRFSRFLNDDGLDLFSGMLALDPYKRLNANDALEHRYFQTDPLPLEPHELPKYEESHEIDKERFKKQKEEEKRRASSVPPTKNPTHNIGPRGIPMGPSSISYNEQSSPQQRLPRAPRHLDTYIPRNRSQEGLSSTHNRSRDEIRSHLPTKGSNTLPPSRPMVDTYKPQPKSRIDEIRGKPSAPLSAREKYGNLYSQNGDHENQKAKPTAASDSVNVNGRVNEKLAPLSTSTSPAINTKQDEPKTTSASLISKPKTTSDSPAHTTTSKTPNPTADSEVANNPHSVRESSPPKPSLAAARSSGIFMNRSRNKPKPKARPATTKLGNQDPLSKRRKLAEDNNDSDLTDFDDDVKEDDSERKLNDFLDWNRYKGSNEYKHLKGVANKKGTSDNA